MFDAIGNMPLHPLILHAAVIGIPLAFLLAVLFAVPRTRSWARWPLGLTAVGAMAATVVSRASGEALAGVVVQPDTPIAPLIARHSQLAGQLVIIMAVFTVLALVCVFVVAGRSGGAGRSRWAAERSLIGVLLPVLLVLVGALAAFWVFRVGDIGSRAVWNPTGTMDYSSSGG